MKAGPNAGQGRKKGVPNRVTAALKDMILSALNQAHPKGGAGYLADQAIKNPPAFMALLGKLLPTHMAGEKDGPVEVRSYVIAPPVAESMEAWMDQVAAAIESE